MSAEPTRRPSPTPWQEYVSSSYSSEPEEQPSPSSSSSKRQRVATPPVDSSGADTEPYLTLEERIHELQQENRILRQRLGTEFLDGRTAFLKDLFDRKNRMVWTNAEAENCMRTALTHARKKADEAELVLAERPRAITLIKDAKPRELFTLKPQTMHFMVTAASSRGADYATKRCNEDKFTFGEIQLNERPRVTVPYYAVFDGHGGSTAAAYCQLSLGETLKNNLLNTALGFTNNNKNLSVAGVFNALKSTCVDLDSRYQGPSGTTATIAIIALDRLWIANVGDSRAIIARPDSSYIPMSADADVHDQKYMKSVRFRTRCDDPIKRGRLLGKISVVRAIGDHSIKVDGVEALSPRPKITSISLDTIRGSQLVLCTDGVTAKLCNKEIAEIATAKLPGTPAENIVKGAVGRKTTDDATVLTVSF